MNHTYSIKNLLLLSSILSVGFSVPNSSNAAFEWTPPAKQMEEVVKEPTDPLMVPAPVADVQPEEALPVIPPQTTTPSETPVEYMDSQVVKEPAVKEMTSGDTKVAEELKDIVQQANENNVITPIAPIPEAEKIDIPVVEVVEDISAEKMPESLIIETAKENDKIEQIAPMLDEAASDEALVEEAIVEALNPNLITGFGKDLPLITAVRQIVPEGTAYSFGESVDLAVPVSWDGGQSWLETIQKIAKANDLIIVQTDDRILLTKKIMPTPVEIEIAKEDSIVENDVMADAMIDSQPISLIENTEDVIEANLSDAVVISSVEETLSIAPEEEIKSTLSNMEEGDIVAPLNEIEVSSLPEDNISEDMIMSPVVALENAEITSIPEQQIKVIHNMSEVEMPEQITENIQPRMQSEIISIEMPEEGDDIEIVVIDTEKAAALTEKMMQEDMPAEMVESMPVDLKPNVIQEAVITEPVKEVMPLTVLELEPEKVEQEVAMVMPPSVMDAIQEEIAPVIPMVSGEIRTWKVKKNSDLKETLETWSAESGVELQWNLPQDYTIDYMVWVDGSFEEAVNTLMQGYSNQKGIIPSASIQVNSFGKPVLVVDPSA